MAHRPDLVSTHARRAASYCLLTAGLLVGLGACFGSVSEVRHRHYTLDGRKISGLAEAASLGDNGLKSQSSNPKALPHTVWVRDLNVAAIYDRSQLVGRTADHEVRFSRNEVWATRLGRMLADTLAHDWLAAGAFESVNRTATESTADLIAVGEVMALEVIAAPRSPGAVQAHLCWVLQVMQTGSGRVLAQHLFDGTQDVTATQHGVAADPFGPQAVQALNQLVGRAVAEGLDAALAALADPHLSPKPEMLPSPLKP